MSQVLTRHEVPQAHRWNAESIFATPAAWDDAYRALEADLDKTLAYQGTLAQGPARFLEWMAFSQDLARRFGSLRVYSTMEYSCDTTDQAATERADRIRGLAARLATATSFAEPELLTIGFETLWDWLEQPRLALYRHYLERLERRAAHVRSAEVEALLGELSSPFGTAVSVHGVLANTDLPFAPAVAADGRTAEITQGNIRQLLGDPDRALRQSAHTNYADAHLSFKTTMAAALSAGIKQNNFSARARRYDSALTASLEPEAIPETVFYTLIDTFKANLSVWHRYWHARKRILGLDELHPHDIFAPLSKNPPVVSYEQSVVWLEQAMTPLGPAYTETMTRGALAERWVDRAINKGKRMGAFSTGAADTPPFIMMSYSDDVFGMSTLAHELGHSMHSYLSRAAQPQIYARYSLFVAEVASNFNQAMLRAHLFAQHDEPDFVLAVIEEAMANFHRYFFVMPTLARFELELHQRDARGEALSADTLTTLMAELFAEGYGDAVVMDTARVGITWAQFHTHLYSRFYVYQYATGISGAHALANRILAGEAGAAERYLEFLQAGGSCYALEALTRAGVDLTTPAPVEETFAVLEGLVERLEGLAD